MTQSSCQPDESEPANSELRFDTAEAVTAIVSFLREQHGLDFSGYRNNMLARRLLLHLHAAGAPSIARYLEQLREDPAETVRLIGRLTIKVSGFFRDATVFSALRELLRQRLLEQPESQSFRAWSAGCAFGEEPYGLAMLAHELRPSDQAASIVATDLDAAVVERAAAGCFAPSALKPLSDTQVATWFEPVIEDRKQSFRAQERLRQAVRFVQHDLNSGSPPEGGPFDLVLCRNVLIYWNRPAQARIQELLCRSLVPGGLLCLGRSEWLSSAVARRFEVLDSTNRIFRLRPTVAPGDR